MLCRRVTSTQIVTNAKVDAQLRDLLLLLLLLLLLMLLMLLLLLLLSTTNDIFTILHMMMLLLLLLLTIACHASPVTPHVVQSTAGHCWHARCCCQ